MGEIVENRVKFKEDVEYELQKSCENILGCKEPDKYWNELVRILTRPPGYTTLRGNTRRMPISQIAVKLQNLIDEQDDQQLKVEHHPHMSDLLIIKNIGPNDCVEKLPLEVIVDHACGMAVLRGAEIYCQGVMSMSSGTNAKDMVSVYSDVDGMCRKGQTGKFNGRKLFLGTGKARVSRKELFTEGDKSGLAVTLTLPLFKSPSLSAVLPDLVYAQNLPSVVCVHVLDPRADERVLDMCAAPGGKTNHIASKMGGKGTLIALEKAKNKICRIHESLKRWNLEENVHVHCFDSTKAYAERGEVGLSPPWPARSFDRILVDGPCSALGQRPYYNHKLSLPELRSYPVLQRKLLQAAVPMLKSGGTLVYSTCTFAVQENEAMVAWALGHFPELRLAKQDPYLGQPGWAGCGLTDEQRQLVQRFDPVLASDAVNHDTTAFFIAKFTKI